MVQRPSNNPDFFNIQNKIILLELKNKIYKIMTRFQIRFTTHTYDKQIYLSTE